MLRGVALFAVIVVLTGCGDVARHTNQGAVSIAQEHRCPGATTEYSAESNRRLVDELTASGGKNAEFLSIRERTHDVFVDLKTGREDFAAALIRRYGDRVFVSVAGVEFCGHPGNSPVCPPLRAVSPTPSNLTFQLRLERTTIKATDDLRGTLTVHASAGPPYRERTGQPLVAEVVKPGTRTVVGHGGLGAIRGTGHNLTALPGADDSVGVVVGTARCDGGPGSALPPGDYGVLVVVAPEGPAGAPAYVSNEVKLTVAR